MVTSEQIISTRRRLKLSQAGMASEFGVNLATVWRWENVGVPEQGTAAKTLEKWVADNASEASAA